MVEAEYERKVLGLVGLRMSEWFLVWFSMKEVFWFGGTGSRAPGLVWLRLREGFLVFNNNTNTICKTSIRAYTLKQTHAQRRNKLNHLASHTQGQTKVVI